MFTEKETMQNQTSDEKIIEKNSEEVRKAVSHKRAKRPYGSKRKVCRLCAERIRTIDYKQIQILKTFCTDTGKILSRRVTGSCAKHQRQIARAIKINRNLGLMPYTTL